MAKEYEILDKQDFLDMIDHIYNYMHTRELQGLPFQKLRITSKKWQKGKTSPQHRKYWKCIQQIKEGMNDLGNEYNEEDISQFIKMRSGFTKVVDGQVVTKSIADKSEDATNANLRHLIDFMIRFGQEYLGIEIE
jgi:hypothetical protein